MRIRIQSTESIGIMLALCLRNSAADLDPGMGKNPDPYDGGSNQIWDPHEIIHEFKIFCLSSLLLGKSKMFCNFSQKILSFKLPAIF